MNDISSGLTAISKLLREFAENNYDPDTATTFRQILAFTEQLFLLDLLEDLVNLLQDDPNNRNTSPVVLKTFNDFNDLAKTRFDDPSFQRTWESIATTLIGVIESKDKELGSTVPALEINKYITLVDDVKGMKRQLARLDELIREQ